MAQSQTSNVTNVASTAGASALGIAVDRRVIGTFQPVLYYEQLAQVKIMGEGAYYDRFNMFDQIATASVSTLTEGTGPTGLAASATVKDVTPVQYGLSVELTDLVVATTSFDLVMATAEEVGKAMARKIDKAIQAVANAGTNVVFPGAVANRTSITASDKMDYVTVVKVVNKLRKNSAPTWEGNIYRGVMTIDQVFDLKANTSIGQFTDVSKYANPDRLLNGEIGMIDGARLIGSSNVDTFASTVTVHPALFAGRDGLRVTYWIPSKTKTYINLPESNINLSNPLGQKGNVGSKVTMGVSRVREEALARIETAATVL